MNGEKHPVRTLHPYSTAEMIISHLDSPASRHGGATVQELEQHVGPTEQAVWDAVAVLLLRRQIVLRSITKKRILVVKNNHANNS